jgi:hypothetical protein
MKILNNKRFFVGLVLVCFFASNLISQDFKQDITKANTVMANTPYLDCNIKSTAYPVDKDRPIESNEIKITKREGNFLYETGPIQSIFTNGYTIILHEEEKVIICNKNEGLEKIQLVPTEEILKSMDSFDKITFLGIDNNLKHYSLERDNDLILKIEIFLDAKTGVVTKMIQYYDTDNYPTKNKKIVMELRSLDLNPVLKERHFERDYYVKISENNHISTTPQFENYQLVLGKGMN